MFDVCLRVVFQPQDGLETTMTSVILRLSDFQRERDREKEGEKGRERESGGRERGMSRSVSVLHPVMSLLTCQKVFHSFR